MKVYILNKCELSIIFRLIMLQNYVEANLCYWSHVMHGVNGSIKEDADLIYELS